MVLRDFFFLSPRQNCRGCAGGLPGPLFLLLFPSSAVLGAAANGSSPALLQKMVQDTACAMSTGLQSLLPRQELPVPIAQWQKVIQCYTCPSALTESTLCFNSTPGESG